MNLVFYRAKSSVNYMQDIFFALDFVSIWSFLNFPCLPLIYPYIFINLPKFMDSIYN